MIRGCLKRWLDKRKKNIDNFREVKAAIEAKENQELLPAPVEQPKEEKHEDTNKTDNQ